MKVRQHRELLSDSMATVVEIEPTLDALAKLISCEWGRIIKAAEIGVSEYCKDERIGWNTHIITTKHGVFGFCDCPIDPPPITETMNEAKERVAARILNEVFANKGCTERR